MKNSKYENVDFDVNGVVASNEGENECEMLNIPFPLLFKYIHQQEKLGRKAEDITREELIEKFINV